MRDRVAEVLAQREALEHGPGPGIALSLLLHIALAAAAIYAAMRAPAPQPARMVSIQLASPASPAPVQQRAVTRPKPVAPKIEEPKPKIEEPKPEPVKQEPPKQIEKNTVPLSPFGRSTKKGSDAPAPAPPTPATNTAAATSTAPEIPIGGSGVTGLEGGDFPYTLYIQAMHRRVGAQWVRMPGYSGPAAVVYFRILRDGTITEAKVATPSGNPTFDRAALSAVRSASPLNPLPFAYNGTFLGVYLTFR